MGMSGQEDRADQTEIQLADKGHCSKSITDGLGRKSSGKLQLAVEVGFAQYYRC